MSCCMSAIRLVDRIWYKDTLCTQRCLGLQYKTRINIQFLDKILFTIQFTFSRELSLTILGNNLQSSYRKIKEIMEETPPIANRRSSSAWLGLCGKYKGAHWKRKILQ